MKYYPITEYELNRIKNGCYYPDRTDCTGCDMEDDDIGCKFIVEDLYAEILSRERCL